MKKIAILFICIIILSFSACGNEQEEFQEPTNFYYCAQDIAYNNISGVIKAEQREAIQFHGNLASLLRSYLHGPSNPELQMLIPSNVTLISCAVNENAVTVTLSEPFSKLTGIKLSTASTAMLMTIYDYAGVDTLCVRAENALLDEKDEIVITIDDIMLLDSVENGEQYE